MPRSAAGRSDADGVAGSLSANDGLSQGTSAPTAATILSNPLAQGGAGFPGPSAKAPKHPEAATKCAPLISTI